MSATDDDKGLLLKLANEAGGSVDIARLKSRPLKSSSRQAFDAAVADGLIDGSTGNLTPAGYRWLGDWLNA